MSNGATQEGLQSNLDARGGGLGGVLSAAAWFGLVSGLVEASGLLLFQKLDWMNWLMQQMAVAPEILWISPAMNLLLFSLVGFAIIAAGALIRRLPVVPTAFFVFGALTAFDWLSLTGTIRLSGIVPLSLGVGAVLWRWSRARGEKATRWCRRMLPLAAGLALLALAATEGGGRLREAWATSRLPAAPADTPNILVIVMDTLRADHLSCYGYARNTSPRIDQLAQQSVVFDSAIAPSSWTLPSHVSLLTGRFAFEHGAEKLPYDGRYPMLPEFLQACGYRTAAISANTAYFGRREGFGRGFVHFEDYFHTFADRALRTLYGRKFEWFVLMRMGFVDYPTRKRASEVTDAALHWLDRASPKPFFLFLNYFDVHDPYLPPEPYRSRFSKKKSPGGRINGKLLQVNPKLTPEQIQEEIDAYDGGISYADEHIGRLLDGLKRRGLAVNTIVVLTSDHGESLGEHGIFHHRNALYRELIRVPLMIHWAGKTRAGLRVRVPVSLADLPATLREMTGAAAQSEFPGPSLVALWTQPQAQPIWPYPLAELAQFHYEAIKNQPTYYGPMKSLVSAEWQFIRYQTLPRQLFDWQRDPGQKTNLTDSPEGSRVADEMSGKLDQILGLHRKSLPSTARYRNP